MEVYQNLNGSPSSVKSQSWTGSQSWTARTVTNMSICVFLVRFLAVWAPPLRSQAEHTHRSSDAPTHTPPEYVRRMNEWRNLWPKHVKTQKPALLNDRTLRDSIDIQTRLPGTPHAMRCQTTCISASASIVRSLLGSEASGPYATHMHCTSTSPFIKWAALIPCPRART